MSTNVDYTSQIDQFVFFFSILFLFSELREVECAIFTLIANIPHDSIVSFIGVYGSKFTKFSTLLEHRGDCLPIEFEWRRTAENFEKIAKNLNFLHLYVQKRCVYIRGSKVKVEHTLVGYRLAVPQPF